MKNLIMKRSYLKFISSVNENLSKGLAWLFLRSLLVIFFLISHHVHSEESFSLERFHTCTIASHHTQNLEKLVHSCRKNQIDLEILGMGQPYLGNGMKLIYMKEYLSSIPDEDIVMYVDAFDVIIVGTKTAILEKFFKMNAPFVMSAELNCFPYQKLIKIYPESPSLFKYLNTGAYIGYAKDLKAWLKDLGAINPKITDQGQITRHYLKGNTFFLIDHFCELFLSLCDVKKEEVAIDQENGVVHCLTTQSQPLVIHANAHSFEIWNRIYQQLIEN